MGSNPVTGQKFGNAHLKSKVLELQKQKKEEAWITLGWMVYRLAQQPAINLIDQDPILKEKVNFTPGRLE